jgi:hypothetical protein
MDTSFGIKPRPHVPARSHALRDPVAVREAADTELGPARAVAAASDGATRHDGGRRDDAPARESLIDPRSQDALLRAANRQDRHVEQSPNQVLLGRRAYRRQLPHDDPASDDPAGRDPHADIEA